MSIDRRAVSFEHMDCPCFRINLLCSRPHAFDLFALPVYPSLGYLRGCRKQYRSFLLTTIYFLSMRLYTQSAWEETSMFGQRGRWKRR